MFIVLVCVCLVVVLICLSRLSAIAYVLFFDRRSLCGHLALDKMSGLHVCESDGRCAGCA